ncbi:MAG: DNA primase [Gammaproteobacteria bacterium]|nr:DNA primase [Gammaproteobacteria bacterium]
MSLIPQSFIDNLLSRIDIIDVIGSRIKLKKAGSNYSALCPFHTEKTPSFTVSQSKQFYHCFGCGVHGSAITFIMQFEKLSFVEAVESLAGQIGLQVPKTSEQSETTNFTEIYCVLEDVAKLYQNQLPHAERAIKYLKSRGLTGEICKRFGIGYALPDWDNLRSLYHNSTNNKLHLQSTGLLIEKGQDTFSRFRDRIMFPIRNTRGKVIGFGGRSMGNDPAKYLNSPESAIFHKGSELYGLHEAKNINKNCNKIIVVEGYIDVISLVQYKITNVVATLGTAITTKQVQLLLKNFNQIYFCFDGDNAGRGAAWRALENIIPIIRDGVKINFLLLPQGDDPDSLIRKEGKESFLKRLAKATTFSDFFFDSLSAQANLINMEDRAKLAQDSKNLLSKMPNGVFKQLLFEKLSELVKFEIKDTKQHSPTEKKLADTKNIVPEPSMHPILQTIISLLLYNTQLVETLADIDSMQSLNIPGIDIFFEFIKLLRTQANLTIGAILEYWRGRPAAELIANIAADEPIIPEDGFKNELSGLMRVLARLQYEQKIQLLLKKASENGLELTEKDELQKLILAVKNIKQDY